MIDSTTVRATRASIGVGKKVDPKDHKITRSGAARTEDQAPPVVRGQWSASENYFVGGASRRHR